MVREKGPYFMSELFYSLFILSLSFFQENWSWFWNQKGIFKDNYYYYYYFQKENLSSLISTGAASVGFAVLSLCCVHLSALALSVPLKRLSFKSHSSAPSLLPLRSCDRIRKLVAEAFSFPGWSLGISPERASVMIMYKVGRSWWNFLYHGHLGRVFKNRWRWGKMLSSVV